MPQLFEFRIPLPLDVDEFHRGQLYMTAKAELEAATGREGVVVLKNEPYDNTDGHMGECPITGTPVPRDRGQYTLKHYVFASKVPGVLKALAPASALYLIEVAWNAYPHCKTVLVSGYLAKETLKIDVETLHVAGDAYLDNALGLSAAELKQRVVEFVDIRSAAQRDKPDYAPERDASLFRSAKTGRGPLADGWYIEAGRAAAAAGGGAGGPPRCPFMCAYKVVRVSCTVFGLGGTVEGAVLGQQRGLFAATHCKAFVTIDEWIESTIADIRRLEDEAAAKTRAIMGDAAAVPAAAKA
jgi:hypothetical protein